MKAIFSLVLMLMISVSTLAWEPSINGSGKGIIIHKVEGDAPDIILSLKTNLEANQITIVDVTNPSSPLVNNVKIFPDYDKLKIAFIQNFLVTSITTLYTIFTNDPNAMVLSPLVITVYQVEDDDYTYIVRTKASMLLEGTKYPKVKKAVEELESRIDQAIEDIF
jgi:predicted RecB family endonuclease